LRTNPRAALSDRDFIKLFNKLGAKELAKQLGHNTRTVTRRRVLLENRHKLPITAPTHPNGSVSPHRPQQYPWRAHLDVKDGHVLIGSDAHIWPGPMTTAMRAFIKFAKELKPKAVILNGDVMDFSQISRHDPLGWESQPEVVDEIEAAQDILHEIEKAAGRAQKIWTFGNHDQRFERTLAIAAPKFAKVHGVHLKDHFPLWTPCWSVWVNPEDTYPVVVKHRGKGGDHAPFNNVVKSGTHIVTAHLHSAKVIPFTHYKATLYGVDDGCLCDPNHKSFLYAEDGVKNWRSGFCVLTFKDGRLLQPQLALVHDDKHVDFCGALVSV